MIKCVFEKGSDQAFAKYLQNSEMIKCVFEKEITDVETNIIYGDSVGDET
jgi:hypothetical protein